MADIKISELPAALSLTDTDILPVVNSATTKKATAAQLVAGGLSAGTANGLVYLNGAKTPTSGSSITYDGSTFGVSVNSAANAVTITQTGAGNALVIEDSASTDSTPFVIDASGRLISGHTNSVSISGTAPQVQIHSPGAGMSATRYGNNNSGFSLFLAKSRSTTAGEFLTLNSADQIGNVIFSGADGTSFIQSAVISTNIDGTPGTNSMPGRLVFSTTRGGKFTISSIARVSNVVTVTASAAVAGLVAVNDTVVIESVTDTGFNGTFTITAIPTSTTFTFDQTAADASSSGGTATVQVTTPTERLRIDSKGSVGIGTSPAAGYTLDVRKNITGAVSAGSISNLATIQQDVTTQAFGVYSQFGTAAASFTLPVLSHFHTSQGTFGAGSSVTNQYGFNATSNLTGATNNYGFYSNLAAATGRWNFYANGTAANYFAGDMQLGKTVTAAGTTGAQTINKTIGSVNFAAAATSLVVTNNLVTTSSIIIATVASNDSTMKSVAVVAGSGSFTIYANAAATAETRVNFQVFN